MRNRRNVFIILAVVTGVAITSCDFQGRKTNNEDSST